MRLFQVAAYNGLKTGSSNGGQTAPAPAGSIGAKPDFPAQPDRPAPVLKPSVARKPSIDKSVLIRKNSGGNGQSKPTYEDTLKKCQSLTSSKPTEEQPKLQPKSSPALPPKPSLAALRQSGPIAHLPPSGSVRSNSANGRLHASSPLKSQQHQLNQAFLNDLHTAMAAKLNGGPGNGVVTAGNGVATAGNGVPMATPDTDDDEAASGGDVGSFPNPRFSTGEYDNIKKSESGGSGAEKGSGSGPAIPKRSNDHLHPAPDV